MTPLSGGEPIGAPYDGDREITVDCFAGPILSIAGQTVRTSVTASAEQFRSGEPLKASVCDADTPVNENFVNPVSLPEGRQDVVVEPGASFFVDGIRLRTMPIPAQWPTSSAPQAARTTAWSPDHREVTLTSTTEDRLLVIPESNNSGWRATTPGGVELSPVVVDGWQQAWIVPAGASGTISLDFATDRWYRLGIFGGLLLLIPLLFAALRRPRSMPDLGPAPRPWQSLPAAIVTLLGATIVLAGIAGAAAVAVIGVGAVFLDRRYGRALSSRVLVSAAGGFALLGAALLSLGPWRSPDGYVGESYGVQLAALIGIVALAISAMRKP